MSSDPLTTKGGGESIGKLGPIKQVLPTEKTKDLRSDDMSKVKAIAGKTLGTFGESSGKKP